MSNNALKPPTVPEQEIELLFGPCPPVQALPVAGEDPRQAKGKEIAVAGLVEFPALPVAELRRMMKAGHSFPVRSQSNPARRYRVNGTCDCKDYQLHASPGFRCKHQVAQEVRLAELAEAERADLEEVLALLGQDQARWPLTIQWPSPRRLSEEDYVEWRVAHTRESAQRDDRGRWEFIPVNAC